LKRKDNDEDKQVKTTKEGEFNQKHGSTERKKRSSFNHSFINRKGHSLMRRYLTKLSISKL